MVKLYTREGSRLLPAFIVPDDWIAGWSEHGWDKSYRVLVPAPSRLELWPPAPVDMLPVTPTLTLQVVPAYCGPPDRRETPVPSIILLDGAKWLRGHPLVKELEHV